MTLSGRQIADILTVVISPLLLLENEFHVVGAIDDIKGKYPASFGNVFVIERRYFQRLLIDTFTVIIQNPLVRLLAPNLNPDGIVNAADSFKLEVRLEMSQLHLSQAQDFALAVYVMFNGRIDSYVKPREPRKKDFLALSNAAVSAIGYNISGISFSLPLVQALEASSFISILLDEVNLCLLTTLGLIS